MKFPFHKTLVYNYTTIAPLNSDKIDFSIETPFITSTVCVCRVLVSIMYLASSAFAGFQ